MIALIAAMDRKRAIGRDGDMPWHLPDDLRRFKQLTLGKAVLMGRKTALSIGRTLPGRSNLVLTHQASAPFAQQIVVESLDAALLQAGTSDLMVIGGGEVYAQALDRAQRLHLTLIDTEVPNADTWFPPFDASRWQLLSEEPHAADARHAHAFRFCDYQRTR